MSKKILAIAISVALLITAMLCLYITAQHLSNADFFYGVFASLAFMIAGWIGVGFAYKEKKKEKGEKTQCQK
jgi:hypothetical protein